MSATLVFEPAPWLAERLPATLLGRGPLGLAWWQWLALATVVALGWLIGLFVSRATRAIMTRIAQRTVASWDDAVATRLTGPLRLAWTTIACRALLPVADLSVRADAFVDRLLKLGLFVAFFWGLGRALDVALSVVLASPWTAIHPASRSLVPLAGRIGKVALVAIAVVAILAELGYPVASLIAGLGIGGIALALAAQKTVENLFGAFSIGVDQPFREGDFVKIDDVSGTVEAIGLRSTRFRTLDRTLVTIPNGKLAEMRIENFAPRDRIRFATVLGVSTESTAEQLRAVLASLERVLRDQPKLVPDSVVVRFKEIANAALNVEIVAVFDTRDYAEFQRILQEVLFGFLDAVEKAGTSFAFPPKPAPPVALPAAPR